MSSMPPPPPPPPGVPPAGAPGPGGPTNMGLAPNVGGLLCYVPCCVGLVFSIVVVVVEKQSRFLRFHAFQSLVFHAVLILAGVALAILTHILGIISVGIAALVGFLLNTLMFLAALAATIFLMVKAYGGEEFEIPTLGPMARQWV
jgi:uncharacterized membrane protein